MKPVNGLKLLAIVVAIIIVGFWLSDQIAKHRGQNWLRNSSYWSRYQGVRSDFHRHATNGDGELEAILYRRDRIVADLTRDLQSKGIKVSVDQPKWWISGGSIDARDPQIRIYGNWPKQKLAAKLPAEHL